MKSKKIFGIAALFVTLFTFSSLSSFAGEIHITLYGSGGIIQTEDGVNKVCPNANTAICATLTVPSIAVMNNSVSNAPGILNYQGNDHNITVISLTGIQGSGSQRTASGSNLTFTTN